MRRLYERRAITGAVITQMKPEVWSKAKVLSSKQQPDGKYLVELDMTGLDEDALWAYLVLV